MRKISGLRWFLAPAVGLVSFGQNQQPCSAYDFLMFSTWPALEVGVNTAREPLRFLLRSTGRADLAGLVMPVLS